MSHNTLEQGGSARRGGGNGNPRVSIGIPVFSGENYLGQALDSILAQSFEDFEVIISDNASTDATEEICRTYAAKDPRIHYHRNTTNIGSGKNFNHVFNLAKGEYFKWTAHDDICSPDFVKSCVGVLDADPSVVLCHATPVMIDAQGKELPNYMKEHRYADLNYTDSYKPHKRLYDIACLWHACFQVFGIVRADVLRQTPLIGNYIGADRVLLAELAFFGRYHEVPEHIYFRRHAEQYCALKSAQSQSAWYAPEMGNRRVYPTYRNFVEYLGAIQRTPLSWQQKTSCYATMLVWMLKKRDRLGKELLSAFRSAEKSHA